MVTHQPQRTRCIVFNKDNLTTLVCLFMIQIMCFAILRALRFPPVKLLSCIPLHFLPSPLPITRPMHHHGHGILAMGTHQRFRTLFIHTLQMDITMYALQFPIPVPAPILIASRFGRGAGMTLLVFIITLTELPCNLIPHRIQLIPLSFTHGISVTVIIPLRKILYIPIQLLVRSMSVCLFRIQAVHVQILSAWRLW